MASQRRAVVPATDEPSDQVQSNVRVVRVSPPASPGALKQALRRGVVRAKPMRQPAPRRRPAPKRSAAPAQSPKKKGSAPGMAFSAAELERLANPARMGSAPADERDEEEEDEEDDDDDGDDDEKGSVEDGGASDETTRSDLQQDSGDDDGSSGGGESGPYDDDEEGAEDDDGSQPPDDGSQPPDDDDGQGRRRRAAEPKAPVQTPEERAREKARLCERLRRSKAMYGERDEGLRRLCSFQDDDLIGLPLQRLRDLDAVIRHRVRSDSTVTFYRRCLIQFAVLVERVNIAKPQWFGGMDIEGFSAALFNQLTDYDPYLYDIYDMYGDTLPDNPIVALGMQLTMHMVVYSKTKAMQAQLGAAQQPSAAAQQTHVPPSSQQQQQARAPFPPQQSFAQAHAAMAPPRPPPVPQPAAGRPPQPPQPPQPDGEMPPPNMTSMPALAGSLRERLRAETAREQQRIVAAAVPPPALAPPGPVNAREIDPPARAGVPQPPPVAPLPPGVGRATLARMGPMALPFRPRT
jgi:hypothetical protein